LVPDEELHEEALHEETWSWTLYRTAEGLLLIVVCGSVGIYERSLLLTDDEAARWERCGPAGLEPMVEAVRNDVTGARYGERYIR